MEKLQPMNSLVEALERLDKKYWQKLTLVQRAVILSIAGLLATPLAVGTCEGIHHVSQKAETAPEGGSVQSGTNGDLAKTGVMEVMP